MATEVPSVAPATFEALVAAEAAAAEAAPAEGKADESPPAGTPASTMPETSSPATDDAATAAPPTTAEGAASADTAGAPSADAPKPDSITRRLALVAKEDTRVREGREALDRDKAALAGDLATLQAIRSARTHIDRVKALYGDDDEAVAGLFLELREHHAGQAPPATEEERIRREVDARLKERDTAATTDQQRRDAEGLAASRAGFAKATHALLEQSPEKYPLTYTAPPSAADLAAVKEAAWAERGERLSSEQVLVLFEGVRAERAAKTRGKATPATAARPAVKGNDVPLVPAKPMSFDEMLAAEIKKAEEG